MNLKVRFLHLLFLFTFFVFCLLVTLPIRADTLLCGIDRLEESGFQELSGLRVGLITNASGLTRNGNANYAVMRQSGVKLQFLMAPEHGFSIDIEAGQKVGSTVVADTLHVYSLYGVSKKPDISQLKMIDVLVFDLQDIGTRCYTYITTMKNAMEACQEAGITFMVLDRPNPVIPLHPEGFMLTPGYESFVGAVNIPFIHSMTVGEIALFLKEQQYKKLDLRVIQMQGYRRDQFIDEYPGFRFVTPSPNIKNVITTLLYPALVFLEATTVSEGRGTEVPFMQFGAPFINSSEVAQALKRLMLQGVIFHPVTFRPLSGKFRDKNCHGLALSITDRKTFSPFRTAAAILLTLQRFYPDKIGLEKNGEFFDKLAGTSRFRKMISIQMPLDAIMEESRKQVEQFERSTSIKRLYR
ncbi:MAG: DUF1343 domain-containing protein [Chlorobiaceae bacterium]